jgi:hypothetical protein
VEEAHAASNPPCEREDQRIHLPFGIESLGSDEAHLTSHGQIKARSQGPRGVDAAVTRKPILQYDVLYTVR